MQGPKAFSIWEIHLGFVTGQSFRARGVSDAKNESRQCFGQLGWLSPDPLLTGVSHTCWSLRSPFSLGKGAELIFHSALWEFDGSPPHDQDSN